MNCREINEKYRIVEYLAAKKIHPVKIRNNIYYYYSPFRSERTASFKVDDRLNKYYDFGEGLGSNLIGLICRLEGISVKEIVHRYSNDLFSFPKHNPLNVSYEISESKLEIKEYKQLYRYPLKSYLKSRNIKSNKAYTYLNEVIFKIGNSKTQYAIGFKNIDGNYELRNKIFKGCSGKNLSIITNNSEDYRVFIFEGFFDFLSFMELKNYPNFNFIVMNSTANLYRLITYLDNVNYHEIHLYLDNDKTADDCTDKLINIFREAIIDHRIEYKNHKDLNDFLVHQQV